MLNACTNGNVHTIVNNLLGGSSDGHQTRRTLPVHGHTTDADRTTSRQRGQATDVVTPGALAQGAAHDHIIYFCRINTGALHCRLDGYTRHGWCLGVVPQPTIGFTDRGSC